MNENLGIASASLALDDETAWLEQTARAVAERRWEEVETEHLSAYLRGMANRDRREVVSRLTVLLTHLLKWDHQPEKRSRSWEATIAHQRFELRDLLESRTLFNHALEVLDKAHLRAVDEVGKETGLSKSTFPAACPYSLEAILGDEPS